LPSRLDGHAARVWNKAEIDVITLHDARHTFASLMIAAGVNAKALRTFMGHSSITVTLDRYGHLFPGSEAEAADLLDTYLQRANTAARVAAVSDGSRSEPDRKEAQGASPVRPAG
jgi:integrase